MNKYTKALHKLSLVKNGKCRNQCKSNAMKLMKRMLHESNSFRLTIKQRQKLNNKLSLVTRKNDVRNRKTNKKYTNRNSPPYPANENCHKRMIGNDRTYYISTPNKNNICTWKKV